MSVYVGIDVHRKRSQVAVIDQDGEVLANRNVPNGVEPILGVIGGLPPGTPAAFEAAFGWGWLVELLEDYGFAPHLVHPLQCKAIASARLKNDKVDAAILAQLLRADLLPEAWIAPPRGAPAAGAAAAPGPAGAAADAAAQPDPRGPGRPRPRPAGRAAGAARAGPGSPRWSCRPSPAEVIEDDLALIDALQVPIDRLDCEVRQRARSDPRVKVLTQLPGVGPFTALVILAEVGDISRFGSARKLAAWAGLTPTVRGSRPHRPARPHLQAGLGVAAVDLVRGGADRQARTRDFAASYQAIARRRGKKIATTAIARKLLTRAWHLLTDAERAASPTTSAPAPADAVTSREGSPSPG